MTPALQINHQRLLARLHELGEIGRTPKGGRTRLALTDEDKQARDLIVSWLQEAGADVQIDRIGNIYGIAAGEVTGPPVMMGSHIDTVVDAGALDGTYGVIAGIEVLHALKTCGEQQHRRAIALAAFTNEEGVRFAPDLLGSRVIAKDVALSDALNARAIDGTTIAGATIAEELRRIGYAGDREPWELLPEVFLELHIEQGPLLDEQRIPLGIVEAVQGHSWWRVVIEGTANHAGTTPMHLRRDAGMAAMTLATELVKRSADLHEPNVATIGTMALEPNAINVVPGRAAFTLDLRDHRHEVLRTVELRLAEMLKQLDAAGFKTSAERISRHEPVTFDPEICNLLESLCAELELPARRMLSGASHDAQMMARVCPTAMIFVPSRRGISHNPQEHTDAADLVRGADLLLQAVLRLASH